MRSFPTGCAFCGHKRFSGWVAVHGQYRLPLCSGHAGRFLDINKIRTAFRMPGLNKVILTSVPNELKIRWAGVIWRLTQEELPPARPRRKRRRLL